MRLGVSSGFVGKGRPTEAVPPEIVGYNATVQNISGLVSYWRLDSTSGLLDVRGAAPTGTFTGVVALHDSLPVDPLSNQAVDFQGGSATIAHTASHALAAFTLSFWFIPGAMPPEDGALAQPIITKNAATATLGDFICYQPNETGSAVRVRFRGAAGVAIDLDSDPVLSIGETFHVCVRADGTGFELFVNGIYYGKNTNHTTGLSGNAQSLRFAASPTFLVNGDLALDEVALYSRALTDAEVVQLSQVSTLPVATDDTFSIPDSATTALDVLANDTFVGSAPTLAIVAQPAGGDSVAVDGSLINYTALDVGADTARSFQYRLTDVLGQSNTATGLVTVRNVAVASAQANCFTINTTDTVNVANSADLQTQINNAPPGRTILLTQSFAGGTLNLNPQGTANNPIVVRPAGARGTVVINGANWTLNPASSRIVFCNIYFTNSRIVLQGNNHRVTRCRFRDVQSYCVIVRAGFNHRIDHCDCADWVSSAAAKGFVDLPNIYPANGFSGVLVDYNWIHDVTHAIEVNGSSVVDTDTNGTSGAWEDNPGLIIDHNLVSDCPTFPDAEFITVKNSGVIIRFNTFRNIGNGGVRGSYLQQRQGGGWEVRSNWFEQTNSADFLHSFDDTLAGFDPPLVIGNRFEGAISMWVGAGNSAVAGPVNAGYHASTNGQYIGNSLGTGTIKVGQYWNNNENTTNATGNNLFENTRAAGGDAHALVAGNHTGTTFNDPGADPQYDYVAAVEIANPALVVGDTVGMFAADPLCSTGPQS